AGRTLGIDNSVINNALNNAGLLVVRANSSFNGGFVNVAGATLRLLGDGNYSSVNLTVANGFTNSGLIEMTSVFNAQPVTLNVTSGTLVNAAGATIDILQGSGNGGRTINAQLNNQGTLNVGTGAALSRGSALHVNSGTINVSGGDVSL